MTIPFLNLQNLKPLGITREGIVAFTDGTNTVKPNQTQCEAYGFKYDKVTGTCTAFTFNENLERSLINENNNIQGSGNVTEGGTNNTYIMGEDNTVKGLSRNNIVIGSKNQIDRNVNNTFVYGTFGQSTADNSIVLGGNASTDNLGKRQSIQLIYGVKTTAGSTVDSYLNNITNSFLVIPDNTIMYFHADVVAVRVGGSAEEGNVGDYASWVERGVVINKSGTLSVNRERDAIKSNGTVTDWRPTANVSGTNFRMTVRGETNTDIEWCSNITFTQIKTGVSL
tara:strand:+ start:885 stop:1730 length:846 start_codon:yes stop_codon:yes gene_type:complete